MDKDNFQGKPPVVRLVSSTQSSPHEKSHKQNLTRVLTANALCELVAFVRGQEEVFNRIREKYQSTNAQLLNDLCIHFDAVKKVREEMLKRFESGRFAPPSVSNLARRLHTAILSLITNSPEGIWFRKERLCLTNSIKQLEDICLPLGIDLRVSSYLHRGRCGNESHARRPKHLRLVD